MFYLFSNLILVARCLTTLKQVLPKELALLVAVTLYGTRNAPGSQDIAPAHEWLLFSRVLFGMTCFYSKSLDLLLILLFCCR